MFLGTAKCLWESTSHCSSLVSSEENSLQNPEQGLQRAQFWARGTGCQQPQQPLTQLPSLGLRGSPFQPLHLGDAGSHQLRAASPPKSSEEKVLRCSLATLGKTWRGARREQSSRWGPPGIGWNVQVAQGEASLNVRNMAQTKQGAQDWHVQAEISGGNTCLILHRACLASVFNWGY